MNAYYLISIKNFDVEEVCQDKHEVLLDPITGKFPVPTD